MPLGLSFQRLPVANLQWMNNSGIRWRMENDFEGNRAGSFQLMNSNNHEFSFKRALEETLKYELCYIVLYCVHVFKLGSN